MLSAQSGQREKAKAWTFTTFSGMPALAMDARVVIIIRIVVVIVGGRLYCFVARWIVTGKGAGFSGEYPLLEIEALSLGNRPDRVLISASFIKINPGSSMRLTAGLLVPRYVVG